MKKNKLILTKSAELFQEQVDKFCEDGWLIVSGSVIIKETDSGRQWFSCVMESQAEPDLSYPGEGVLPVMSDEERRDALPAKLKDEADIERLMMGFAAASSSHFVHLLYNNNTGNYCTLRGDRDGEIVPNTLSNSPYLSLAAAILEVQKNGI